jgi:uncharacterized protein YjbJ (UPF0337 family)
MSWNKMMGNWEKARHDAKSKLDISLDQASTVSLDKRDYIVGKIQEIYGFDTEDAHKQLGIWIKDAEGHTLL